MKLFDFMNCMYVQFKTFFLSKQSSAGTIPFELKQLKLYHAGRSLFLVKLSKKRRKILPFSCPALNFIRTQILS